MTTLGDIGLDSESSSSDDDLADESLVHDEAFDASMDSEDEADEEREATIGGDEHGNLPGLIDYEFEATEDNSLHRRVTLEAGENGPLPRPPKRPARNEVPVGIAKADLVHDTDWQESGERFDGTQSFPRPSRSNSR